MLDRIVKALRAAAEFIGRFWPTSKDEATVLKELEDRYGRDGSVGDHAIEGTANNEH